MRVAGVDSPEPGGIKQSELQDVKGCGTRAQSACHRAGEGTALMAKSRENKLLLQRREAGNDGKPSLNKRGKMAPEFPEFRNERLGERDSVYKGKKSWAGN